MRDISRRYKRITREKLSLQVYKIFHIQFALLNKAGEQKSRAARGNVPKKFGIPLVRGNQEIH